MRRPFLVSHPVPYRFVPRRGRHERFGFGSSATNVNVDGFGEEPRRLGRLAKTDVFAADGAAWMAVANPATAIGIGEEGLRRVLASEEPKQVPELASIADYLVRSPICYSRVTAPSYARGTSIARGGILQPGDLGEITDDGSERAAQAVRDFVSDRIRLHRGHVYLRYEGVTLHAIDLEGAHEPRFSLRPRSELGPGYYAATRSTGGGSTADQGEVTGIPEELLKDDDAVWFANALANRIGEAVRMAPHGYDRSPVIEAARQRVVDLAPALPQLERDSWTSSLSGDRLLPALVTLGTALLAVRDLADAKADVRGDGECRRQAGSLDATALVLRRHVLPRLTAIPEEDVAPLASLTR